MENDTIVYKTTRASLLAQVLLGVVTAVSFFFNIPKDVRVPYYTILVVELASQVIEFLWYSYVVFIYKKILTWTRYFDWVLSTPVMLVSTSFFFQLRKEEYIEGVFTEFPIYFVLAFNWLMLLFGFLMETNRMGKFVSLTLGGASLVASFTFLSLYVLSTDTLSVGLLFAMYAVWSLYGVAAAFPYTSKNVAYNALDIVSKNFYGFFLLVYGASISV